jgi:hypothetical protein
MLGTGLIGDGWPVAPAAAGRQPVRWLDGPRDPAGRCQPTPVPACHRPGRRAGPPGRLIPKSRDRWAPTIVAGAIGNVRAGLVTRLARKPELAYAAGPDRDVRDAIRGFFAAVVSSVDSVTRTGEPGVPDGFEILGPLP